MSKKNIYNFKSNVNFLYELYDSTSSSAKVSIFNTNHNNVVTGIDRLTMDEKGRIHASLFLIGICVLWEEFVNELRENNECLFNKKFSPPKGNSNNKWKYNIQKYNLEKIYKIRNSCCHNSGIANQDWIERNITKGKLVALKSTDIEFYKENFIKAFDDIITVMNKDDLEYFKGKLLKEKERLESELASVGHINPDNPNDWESDPGNFTTQESDPTDKADNIEEYETNTAILKELETQLIEVNKALERIENGTYGIDEKTGEPIEKGRLEANPSARGNI